MLAFFVGAQFSYGTHEAQGSSHLQLFFEKTVNSFPRLMKEVSLLDLDSGIRAYGNYKGKRGQFVFVTRSPHDGYTLMVYGKKKRGKDSVPDRRLLVEEFSSQEALGNFMRSLLTKPVRAFVY